MADLSNNSFIPKRGPAKRRRGGGTKRIYIFTLISYILMFATLLAAGAVYFYSGYLETQLDEEIAALNSDISDFSEADMERVQEFDHRLSQAANRLDNTISLISVFSALEAATVDSVGLSSLTLTREEDETLLLKAEIETDTFDSTIFQRGVYKRNETITEVTIGDVTTSGIGETDSEETATSETPQVTFTAELKTPITAVLYEPRATEFTPDLPSVEEPVESAAEEDEGSPVEVSNTEDI